LLLFGSAFNRVITFPSYSYIAFMTSGVVVMTTFNGALYGGVEILFDRESKLIYRLISSPIHPSSTIASRILFVLAITSLQSLIVLAVASAVNLRISSGVLGLVLILLLGLMLGVVIISISMALAFGMRDHGAFFSLLSFISLPVIFVSSAFAPLSSMPVWLQSASKLNPLAYAIDGVRNLVLQCFDELQILSIILILFLFDIITFSIVTYTMRREVEL
jgi:ABC-2 type transport system permease protein